MQYKPRFRNWALIGGSLVMLAWYTLTHPGLANWQEHFIVLASTLAKFATPVIAVLFTYVARKALLDYIDLEEMVSRAKKSAVGAGLIFLGTCLLMYGLLGLFGNQVNAQVPQQALQHLPTLEQESCTHWATHPKELCSPALSSMKAV